jgi:DNA-binding CsgD family transcriptional regulator
MQAAPGDLQAFSKVVSSVYASAMDPSRWQTTLCDIIEVIDGRGGAMLVAGPGDNALTAGVGLDSAGVDSYNEHYCTIDPIAKVIESSPVGTVGSVFGVLTEADRSRSEFYQDWALPNTLGDGVFCRFSDRGDLPGWLQVVGEPPQRFASPARLEFVRQLVPHLKQAANFELTAAEGARGLRPTTDVLEHLDRGALLADCEGTVHDVNPAAHAILHSRDGLSIDSEGRLSTAFGNCRASLQRVIAQACGRDQPTATAGSVLITRPSGRRHYVLHALPLGNQLALVTIVDPDVVEWRPPVDAWRSLYGFTWRETVIAQHVLRGGGLQAIADRLQITLSTVRVHLRHIFEKTGTHRQAELARLLTATGPIFTRDD